MEKENCEEEGMITTIKSSLPDDDDNNNALLPPEETTTNKKKQRCIGRKPVTSFEVGKQYDGKVVYIKSNLF